MDRSYTDRLTVANSERVLHLLTTQQHLHPAWPVARIIDRVCTHEGLGERVSAAVAESAGVASLGPVGRLSRRQICDLARTIELTWQKDLSQRVRVA